MNENQSTVFFTALIVLLSSVCPLYAEATFLPAPVESSTTDLAISLNDFVSVFKKRKVPGGSRGDRNEQKVCTVTPGQLASRENGEITTIEVWGDRPFFLWQGSWAKIEVRDIRSGDLMWDPTLDPEQRSIVYGEDGKGKPLQPNRTYYWRLLPAELSPDLSPPRTVFRMMKEDKRNRIAVELAVIESGRVLEAMEGVTAEDTAQLRAEYFADRELWSDALRELYSVENPSEELLADIERIEGNDFCSPTETP